MGSVNDIYLLRVAGTLSGQVILHTLHFKSAVVGTDQTIQQDLIDSWQATSQTPWRDIYGTQYLLDTVSAQRVCGSLPLPAATIETVNLTGGRVSGITGEIAAPWFAGLVRERTGLAGKSYAGRFFTSGMFEGDFSGENIVNPYLGLVQTYATSLASFLVNGADVDWDLFVYSKKLAGIPGTQCQNAGAGVTSTSVSTRLTTMKSRRL